MAKKQRKNKKCLYWGIILILFVAAAIIVYLVWDSYFRDKKSEEANIVNPTTSQTEKKIQENVNQEAEDAPDKPKTVQYDGEDPNVLEELSGVVTYAGVTGQVLMIRVNIDQYLESGECRLELKRGGATIYESVASIVQNASTATCEGFDVPVNDLGFGGDVEIVVNVNTDGKSGVINGEVSL